MIKVILAPDSFKESLSANEVVEYMELGIRRVFPDAELLRAPLADGGEGTMDTLVKSTDGKLVSCQVTGPLNEKVESYFGILGDGKTGIIEMAAASGLALVPFRRRNPFATTTYGTGELIKAALDYGCRKIVVGIGGSATNDGGAGMAQALGANLLDSSGRQIKLGAAGLADLAHIDLGSLDPRLKSVEIIVACDVQNPLCGPTGASLIYGPQKGAVPQNTGILDNLLQGLAGIIKKDLGKDILNLPGAGAAGGLGGGLVAFLNAKLGKGIEIVMETVELEKKIAGGADLVLTGEGRIDAQTIFGKVSVGVAKVARKYGIPVIAVVGGMSEDAEMVYSHGIDSIVSIAPGPISLQDAFTRTPELVTGAVERLMRIIRLFFNEMSVQNRFEN